MLRKVLGDFTAGVLDRVRSPLPDFIAWTSENEARVCSNGVFVFKRCGDRLYCYHEDNEAEARCIAIVQNLREMKLAIREVIGR